MSTVAALRDRLGEREPARVLRREDADERQRPERDEREHEPLARGSARSLRRDGAAASSQSKRYSNRSGSSASARASPCAYSSGGSRSKVENAFERITSSACSRVSSRCWRSCSISHRAGARRRRARLGSAPRPGSARARSRAPRERSARTRRRRSWRGPRSRSRAAPAAPSTRAACANARGRSTRWSAIRITTASNQPALNGSASARATRRVDAESPSRARPSPRTRRPPRRARARAPRAPAASRPVPQPTSSTRLPRSPPSRTSASNTSHQFVVDRAQLLVAGGAPVEPGRVTSRGGVPLPLAAPAGRRP